MTDPRVQKLPSKKLTLYICREFLTETECQSLIEQINANCQPSGVVLENGDNGYRTSATSCFEPDSSEIITLEQKLSEFSGLDQRFGEPIQGQRYLEGEEFKLHTDFFDPYGADYKRLTSKYGQRTWTIMIYLNCPSAGGATRFKAAQKTIKPETGKLLCWNNLLIDEQGNYAGVNRNSVHQGMKVRKGSKHIITKWYRERPYI